MAYEYDVFISYRCKFPHGRWVIDTFLPLFKPFLEDALNVKEVKIFVDVEDIKSGQAWDSKIRNALIRSRILIPILSPAYFHSDWCKREFAFIDYRQIRCGYMTDENPDALIVPIRIFDGDSFPQYVKGRVQIRDFTNFSRVGIEGAQVPRYIEFQDNLLSWVNDVALAYNRAPVWNDEWMNPEWIENSWQNLDQLDIAKSTQAPIL